MAAATTPSVTYAPEDPTLPKPWRGLVDGSTGYVYYWNPETNATQYERPVASSHATSISSKPSSAHISSSVHVQSSHEKQLDTSRKNDGGYERYSRGSNGTRADKSARDGSIQPLGVSDGSMSTRSIERRGSPSADMSAEAYRHRHEITVTGDNIPMPFTSFEATDFPSEILRQIHHAGFSAPTPIQAQSWPIALRGRDIVAIAKTGSGKTLGYLIPGFIHLKHCRNDPKLGPTVLVLSPTRELATQIQDEAVKFGGSSRISCTCLYGGAPKGPQLRDLDRGVDIVVATPGRLNDILEMRRVSLHQVSYLVLDEADRMLDMGFEPQIRKIVKQVPTRRQTLMFTATWPREVRKIAADLLVNPVQVNIGNVDELVANKSITQNVEVLSHMDKQRRLDQLLRSQGPGSKIIIFCATKKMCDTLARSLSCQYGAAAIHGDKSQSDRDYVLNQFRTGRSPVLVATDVAARGLDIKDIRVVINYDFPTGIEDYVHRIGRTGRAGATGVAYTFFSEQDAKYAPDLIKILEGANQRVPKELRHLVGRGGGTGKFGRGWGSGTGGYDGGWGRSNSGYSGREGHSGGYGSGRGHAADSSDRIGSSYKNDFDVHTRGRYERGYSSKTSHSGYGPGCRGSPHRVTRWSDNHNRIRIRSCSHSPKRYERSPADGPPCSFHQMSMEQSQSQSQYRGNPCSPPARVEKAPSAHNLQETMTVGHYRASPANYFDNNAADGENHNGSLNNARSKWGRSPAGWNYQNRNVDKNSRGYIWEAEEQGMIPSDEKVMSPPVRID